MNATWYIIRDGEWHEIYLQGKGYACYADEVNQIESYYCVAADGSFADYRHPLQVYDQSAKMIEDWREILPNSLTLLDILQTWRVLADESYWLGLPVELLQESEAARIALLSLAREWLQYDAEWISDTDLTEAAKLVAGVDIRLAQLRELIADEQQQRDTADLCPYCEMPDTEEFHTNVPATLTEPGERMCHAVSHCRLLDPDKYDDVPF